MGKVSIEKVITKSWPFPGYLKETEVSKEFQLQPKLQFANHKMELPDEETKPSPLWAVCKGLGLCVKAPFVRGQSGGLTAVYLLKFIDHPRIASGNGNGFSEERLITSRYLLLVRRHREGKSEFTHESEDSNRALQDHLSLRPISAFTFEFSDLVRLFSYLELDYMIRGSF